MFTAVGDGKWRVECGNAPVTVADKSHKGGDKDGTDWDLDCDVDAEVSRGPRILVCSVTGVIRSDLAVLASTKPDWE